MGNIGDEFAAHFFHLPELGNVAEQNHCPFHLRGIFPERDSTYFHFRGFAGARGRAASIPASAAPLRIASITRRSTEACRIELQQGCPPR